MSWMQKLFETYERCAGREANELDRLMPISHTKFEAHIEVVLDNGGAFRRAAVLTEKDARNTLIPCTEESGGRSGKKPVNHPLCDKLQYVAGDFLAYGGAVTSGFLSEPQEPHRAFLTSIRAWASSNFGHPKLNAILNYVERGKVVEDLVAAGILAVNDEGKLLKTWTGHKDAEPNVFKVMSPQKTPEDAVVRWRVEEDQNPVSATWDDLGLISAWVSYYRQLQTKRGFCMVTGVDGPLAIQHPARLRHGGDKAKLVSANDTSGYTFRGRFIKADEAASVGFEVSQKAHNALRWLIKNQGYRSGDLVIVSWALSGKALPDPFQNTLELFGVGSTEDPQPQVSGDTAQAFSLRLARAIAGYGAALDPSDEIVVMAIDSATPGRMGIVFYRELRGSEFLERLRRWHSEYAWPQNFGKESKFIGAPSPRDIAESAYGRRLDDKLRKATVERLLPCIIESRPAPRDLVVSAVRRAANRAGMEAWEWEKVLGIACSLFRGHHFERRYEMALEQDRRSRDYLFGRLLAIADNIEHYALSMGGEGRSTTAARLTQRFADRPASTWRNIAMSLRPYMARLRAGERSAGFLVLRERLLDEVTDSFGEGDFTNDTRLSGEFLLGFHCQRQAFRPSAAGSGGPNVSSEVVQGEGN